MAFESHGYAEIMLRPATIGCAFAACIPFVLAAPLADKAFTGLILRDNPEGTVISRVRPGPFMPADADHALLRRSDLLISANGAHVTSTEFDHLIESLHPGDTLSLIIRRPARTDPLAALPKGDPAGEQLEISITLPSAQPWTGTLFRADPDASSPRSPRGDFESRIQSLAQAVGARADTPDEPGLERLSTYLTDMHNGWHDAFCLPSISQCFSRPLSTDAVESQIHTAAKALAASPDQPHIRQLIQSLMPAPSETPSSAGPPNLRTPGFEKLARHLRDSVTIEGPDSANLISTIRDAPINFNRFVRQAEGWRETAYWEDHLRTMALTSPRTDLPDDLRNAFLGEILYWERLENGRYAVVGADGRNIYTIGPIEIVYDLGGPDTYYFTDSGPPNPINHLIIDIDGDDEYISESDFRGPGVAVAGFSLIDDRAGNDTYISSRQFSIAAGLFGVGVILDRAGNDRYENNGPDSGWSLGAGIYGVGLILDLQGNDSYLGEKLTQGAAGPFALGAIIDVQGDDSYKANGPNFPSAYNTPNTFLSMSQGFSMGIRELASGGIGAIYDFAGQDHYNAGEFSQGCGYSFGLGILHDSAGDDTFEGNRYSQAAAAHQAIGILIDDSGNDHYAAHTAACQSGAWDQSITLLIDRAGDDSYVADDLCQGAAAQQAISLFLDLGGTDRYQATGPSIQGCSGPNEYHFKKDGLFSFSFLLDSGGTDDFFSSARKGILRTGSRNAEAPEQSRAFGVFSKE